MGCPKLIDSISDIRAYVLDMPDHSRMGLLGLSYLGRFQMDLNPDQGTLLLKPR